MKDILLSLLLGFAFISFTGCSGSESDATAKKNKCQTGLCGGGKCAHGEKNEIKKAGTKESDKSPKSK